MSQLKTQFFPQDLQYLSYVDVWLPEDAPIAATNRVAGEVETPLSRLLLLADGPVDADTVRLALPHAETGTPSGVTSHTGTLAQRTDHFEREQILAELRRHNQRMTDTAKALGLERSHLYKKCQALGIDLRALRKATEA